MNKKDKVFDYETPEAKRPADPGQVILIAIALVSTAITIVNLMLIVRTHRVGVSEADGVATAVVMFVSAPLLLIQLAVLWKMDFPLTGLIPFATAIVSTVARVVQLRQ